MTFDSEKKGIPGLPLIYFIIILVGLGLLAVNIGANLFWLDSFAEKLIQRTILFQLTQANRAAESVDKVLDVEIEGVKRLAQDIVVGKDDFFIHRLLREQPAFKEISIINLNGQEEKRYSRIIHFTRKDFRSFTFLEEFERAKKGETFISTVGFTKEAEPYIIITTPIRRSEIESPQAVLRAVFYLNGIREEILKIKIGQTGRVSVVDDKGMLIVDPDPSRVLKKANLLALPPTKPLILGEEFKEAKYLNEKGVEVIGVGAPIKFLRWGVIVEQDVAEVEGPSKEVRDFARVFLTAGMIVIGLLIWLAFTIKKTNRELIERGRALELKTKELEEAKTVLEIKVEARTRELRDLAAGLEKEVERRTKEVRERMKELERFQKLAVGRELKMIELKGEIKKLKQELEKYKPR